jgi:hypothetical protein
MNPWSTNTSNWTEPQAYCCVEVSRHNNESSE